VVMDFPTAITFVVWLKDKLESVRKQMGVSDDDWERLSGGTL
jgi:hypothetical protein